MSENVLDEVSSVLAVIDKKVQTKKKKTQDSSKKSVKKLTKKQSQIQEMSRITVLPTHYRTVWTLSDLEALCMWLAEQKMVAVDTETTGIDTFKDTIVGISFYAPHQGWYIPLKHVEDIKVNKEAMAFYKENGEGVKLTVGVDYVDCLPKELVTLKLKPLLEDRHKKFLFHNARFDMHILLNWMGIKVKPYFDTMVAAALLDENESKALKDLATRWLGIPSDRFNVLFGKETFDTIPILINPETRTGNLASFYAAKDTELTYRLYEFEVGSLSHPNLSDLYCLMFDIEMPFLEIAWEAEHRGVRVDKDYLLNIVAPTLHKEADELKEKITGYVGDINLKSPAQLSRALYEELELPKVNMKKPTSTDKKTLTKLKDVHPVISLILKYRSKSKLCDAFADKLPDKIVDGRIHCNFNTVGTVTGRLSSSNPNLQQMPAGNLIRNAFIADPGRMLVSIDYSGQELRVLTHFSMDSVLLDIYANGKDVHSRTAVSVWNIQHPENQVTYEYFDYCRNMHTLFRDADGNLLESRLSDAEYISSLLREGSIKTDIIETLHRDVEMGAVFEKVRKKSKVVNFGIIYGMSDAGLADTLNISEGEAKLYIEAYFAAYPGVRVWMEKTKQQILHSRGNYIKTLLGRKRRVYPEVQSGKPWLIEKAFRMGINAVIQGSSADMTKKAAVDLQPLLRELDSHIVLFIHDEFVFDVPENIGVENLERISEVMCNAIPLVCGLKADIEAGYKWGQVMSEDEIDALREELGEVVA